MSAILYRRFSLFEPTSVPGRLPERLGGFVVAVPLEKFQDFRQRHPSSEDNLIFRSLVSPNEWDEIRHRLRISPLIELEDHQEIYWGSEEKTLREPSFEGETGKKFWMRSKDDKSPL
jgi:hypothetical protein